MQPLSLGALGVRDSAAARSNDPHEHASED